MNQYLARTLFFVSLCALGFGLLLGPVPDAPPRSAALAGPAAPAAERVVFLASELSEEKLIVLSSALAASNHPGLLLLDTPHIEAGLKIFLDTYKPELVVPVGAFSDGVNGLETRLNVKAGPPLGWKDGQPLEVWKTLFPRAEHVVVCPPEPRGRLLQAACLAGAVHAPLFVSRGTPDEAAQLKKLLADWQTNTVYAVGPDVRLTRGVADIHVYHLDDEDAVAAAYRRHLRKQGSVTNLVISNPSDSREGHVALSPLAPWVALQRHAALLLTAANGKDVEKCVDDVLREPSMDRADHVLILADLQSIPMEQRANPVPEGKDPLIDMEPLTPKGNEPFSFAVGRMFNEEPAQIALILARQRLLALKAKQSPAEPRKALVVSNSAGGLPLLETFSRNTAMELRNVGYDTTALFGSEVNKDDLRRLLPDQDIFLWEGHHNTLIKDYCLPEWTEPMQPSVVFLQSCLALKDYKAQPLLERGALCVVGSSTRIYSASGGSFSLSFFDALGYDKQSLGGAMRQSKNFLLAYSLLKDRRLGKDAKLTAVNLRSARAFTLWGDPTLQLPQPKPANDALPAVTHTVKGNTITLNLPDTSHEKATSARYMAQMLPNERLAGLLTKTGEDGKRLEPFLFTEVQLPHAPSGKTPRLHTNIPSSHWVFCWDGRRRAGYLLVLPRAGKDREQLHFHVEWTEEGNSRCRLKCGGKFPNLPIKSKNGKFPNCGGKFPNLPIKSKNGKFPNCGGKFPNLPINFKKWQVGKLTATANPIAKFQHGKLGNLPPRQIPSLTRPVLSGPEPGSTKAREKEAPHVTDNAERAHRRGSDHVLRGSHGRTLPRAWR